MNSQYITGRPITSYEDLVKEKERLTELLKIQKTLIIKDIEEIKAEFRPVANVSSLVGKMLTPENSNNSVIRAGTNITIDLLVARFFSKSNFFLKLLLPAVLKNFSSHYIPKAMAVKKETKPLAKPIGDNQPVLTGEPH